MRIALSASGLVAEDAVVAVSVVILWLVIAIAVMWHVFAIAAMWQVVVAVVPSARSVLLCRLSGAVVQSDIVVWVVVHVLFSSPGLLQQVSSSFLTSPSQQVMPSELVLSPHLIAVALYETNRLLP